ncbi:MAG: LemA family protein [Anaerovoracaceae bacterium]
MSEIKSWKLPLIIMAVVIAFALLTAGVFVSTNNKAINLEEQINGANASIKVQEKRRVDLVYNLVDTVEAYAEHEKRTLQAVTDARTSAIGGNIKEASMAIQAVGEAYPELKANENYKQFMTELALTENAIAEYRNNLNQQIKSYNKFCRKFPSRVILNMMGYEKLEIQYTDYGVSEAAPHDLFNKGDK